MNNDLIPRSNVMKDEFGWEVPFESVPLPSKGVIYNPDLTIYNTETLQIKAMTAKEEDILTSQAYIKDGTVIEHLIKSCLVDKSFDINDLIVGDRNALMVSIRITGYGGDYKMGHVCPHCSSNNTVVAQLSQLGIKRLKEQPLEPGKNLFEYTLPVTGKKVCYKYRTGHDENEASIKEKRMATLGIATDNRVTGYLESVIVSIDGVTDKNKITHFIKNMPALDSRKLRVYIQDSEPGIDMRWSYECKNCGRKNDIMLPITTEFFWPTT